MARSAHGAALGRPRGGGELTDDRGADVPLPEHLGMPLHAGEEAGARILDRLDQSVRRAAGRPPAPARGWRCPGDAAS